MNLSKHLLITPDVKEEYFNFQLKSAFLKQKETKANQFYEKWMDYKEHERRASTATTETIGSVKNGKYKLYDEYNERLSNTPTIVGTPLPPPQPVVTQPMKAKRQSLPIIQPIQEREIPIQPKQEVSSIDWDNLDDELKEKIRKEFGPFYSWVKNGRTDDLKKEVIEKLLFKGQK